jgi:hypothetical protein
MTSSLTGRPGVVGADFGTLSGRRGNDAMRRLRTIQRAARGTAGAAVPTRQRSLHRPERKGRP